MNEFPHSRMFDSDLREILEFFNNLKEIPTEFAELKLFVENYFKNLDIQNEVNTKLEEMYENGELEKIIKKISSLWVTPQTFGAEGNGINDDSDAIKACFADGRPIYIPSGNYLISKQIPVNSNTNLLSFGTFVIATDKLNSVLNAEYPGIFDINDATNVHLSGIKTKTDDNIINWCEYSTISIRNSSNVEVKNTQLIDSKSLCEIIIINSEDITVHHNFIKNCGHGGIMAVGECKNITIDNNYVENPQRLVTGNSYGISISGKIYENQTKFTTNGIVTNNIVIGGENSIWEGIDAHSGNNLLISKNIVKNFRSGIAVVTAGGVWNENVIISNNEVYCDTSMSFDLGITLDRIKSGVCIGNIIKSEYTVQSLTIGVYIRGCLNLSVKHNEIDTQQYGLFLAQYGVDGINDTVEIGENIVKVTTHNNIALPIKLYDGYHKNIFITNNTFKSPQYIIDVQTTPNKYNQLIYLGDNKLLNNQTYLTPASSTRLVIKENFTTEDVPLTGLKDMLIYLSGGIYRCTASGEENVPAIWVKYL